MSVALAGNYWFNSIVLNAASGTASSAPAASPFGNPSAVGSATFTGKAVTQGDVANFLAALASERGMSNPTLSSASEDAQATVANVHLVTFTGSASIDSTGKPAAPTATPGTKSSPSSTPTTGH